MAYSMKKGLFNEASRGVGLVTTGHRCSCKCGHQVVPQASSCGVSDAMMGKRVV